MEKITRTGYSGPCLGELSTSSGLENPLPCWAIRSSVQWLSWWLYFPCCLWIDFYLSQPRTLVPLPFCRTPLKKVFSRVPLEVAGDHNKILPFPSDVNTEQLSSHSPSAQDMCSSCQRPWWPSLHSLHYFSQTREPRTGPNAPVSPVLKRRGEQLLFLTYWLHLINKYKVAIFTARACWTLTDSS